MGLRRFQNFAVGALTAQRLNELVDAVARLQAQVDRARSTMPGVRQSILARITGAGTPTKRQGCNSSMTVVSYPFDEVVVRINPGGAATASTCVSYETIPDGLSSRRNAYLLALEDSPSRQQNDIVQAHLASTAGSNTSVDTQMVYMMQFGSASGVDRYTIIGASASGYTGRRVGGGDSDIVQIVNLYESNYYGALDSPQNPCAQLEARLIPAGSVVFGFTVGSGTTVYTCAPNAFTVTCQSCGGVAESMQQMYDSVGADSAVASRMLGG